MNPYIITLNKINLTHLHEMGGKNASLEEMFNKLQPMGIKVPVDFAVTVERCRHFLSHYKLHEKLKQLWNTIDSNFWLICLK